MTKTASVFRIVYLAAAGLFLAGVIYQVSLAGFSLFVARSYWEDHIGFGHTIGVLLLLVLAGAFLGKLPRADKRLAAWLFVTYVIQAEVFAFIRGNFPVLAALHPVLAMVVFSQAAAVTWRAWSAVRSAS